MLISNRIKLLLLSIIFSSIIPQQINAFNKYGVGSFLAASFTLSAFKDTIAEQPLIKKLAHLTNTDNKDLIDATVLGLYYWAWSYVYAPGILFGTQANVNAYRFNDRYQTIIRPLIQIIATSNTYNNFIKKIPLLNTLACTSPDCQGVCDACEYKHLIRKAPFELLPQAITYAKNVYDWHQIAELPEDQRCLACVDERAPTLQGGARNGWCQNNRCQAYLCGACYQRIRADQNRCPHDRFVFNNNPVFPAAAPHPDDSNWPLLKEKLISVGIHEPIWTVLRRNKIFLYRWISTLWRINPLYDNHLFCENKSCISICNQCKLKKIYNYLPNSK